MTCRSAVRAIAAAFALVAAVLTMAPAVGATYPYANTRPESIKAKPLSFAPPEPYRTTLPNGMVVYALEDHQLPLVEITAYIKVGSIYDPADKAGLAEMTGSLMRTGGTLTRTGDEIDEQLEYIAASVEVSIGHEYGTASLSVLKQDLDQGLAIFADVLMHPAFREDKVELARQQILEEIRRRNDDPPSLADREFMRLVYGPDSPWARIPMPATIKSITRQDLLDLHARYFVPNHIILAASGDFSRADLIRKLQALFGAWPRQSTPLPQIPDPPASFRPGVYFIPKSVPQSVVEMGHFGIKRMSPDQYAVQVMDFILGASGFTSRLMSQVRTARGLAYEVYAVVSPNADGGLFRAVALTKASTTAEADRLMVKILHQMQTQPPTDAEMQVAKDSLINSFVFEYDTPEKLVSQRALREMLGYPPDYLKSYPANIRKVTKAEVVEAARKYLHPDRMVQLIVGDKAQLEGQLATLGSVTTVTPAPVE